MHRQEQPFLIEIAGPAGAGKSSLLRELRRQNPALSLFADRLKMRDLQNIPFYLGSSVAALPALLRSPWQERWYTREEISRILYLVGMHRFFQRHLQGRGATVLDQGPIFELTYLRAFGPAKLHSQIFTEWWSVLFQRWAQMVRMVVWLDAPDEVLIPRIRKRDQAHAIKNATDAEAHIALAHYRSSFVGVMEQLQRYATIPVLTFTTHRAAVEEVAHQMLQKLEQITHVNCFEKRIQPSFLEQAERR